jgi:hypothetical protein
VNALVWYLRFLVLAIVAQFYAAGLALFGATSFVPHALIGWSFMPLALILVVWSAAAKAKRPILPLALVMFLLVVAQPVIVFGLRRWPAASALHPLVALLIAVLLLELTRRAQHPDIIRTAQRAI